MSLKSATSAAEELRMIFLRRTSPVHVRPEGVSGLRRSLNTPVVSTPDFPTGPAEGAILVHRELTGRLCVTLGIRSDRAGETALWDYDGQLADPGAVDVAVDAALSFAEGMGFLFDDDEVGAGTEEERLRARYLWEGMMGTGEISGLEAARPAAEPAPDPKPEVEARVEAEAEDEAELLLEDEADDDMPWSDEEMILTEVEVEVEAENTGPLVEASDAGPPSVQLSKFRTVSTNPDEPMRRVGGLPPARRGGLPEPAPRSASTTVPDAGLSSEALAAWDEPGLPVDADPALAGRRAPDLADVTQPVGRAEKPAKAPGGSGQPRAPVRDAAARQEGGVKAKGKAALGRLKLVKRRPNRDGKEHRSWLQRVLTAF